MRNFNSTGWFLWSLLGLVVLKVFGSTEQVPLKIVNFAGEPVEVYWINTFEEERVPGELNLEKQLDKPLRNSSEVELNSYDTHQFMVKFFHHRPGTEASFTKGPTSETVEIHVDETGHLRTVQLTDFDKTLGQVEQVATTCEQQGLEGDELTECIASQLVHEISALETSRQTLRKYYKNMASRMRNYTCADEALESSEPIDKVVFRDSDGLELTANILLDTPVAKIWYVENFATDAECAKLMDHGRPLLKRATVAAEDGTSVISENRKAQQALYEFNRDNLMDDPLGPLYGRVLSLTNANSGFDLKQEGQEHFTIIQYNVDDQYTPHCDGACSGEKHTHGGRVATAVVYCKVADRGGGITFSNADLYYKPTNNSAVFFTYMGPGGKMDEGFTEHSSCPVLDGEKWAATAWMRLGVTREDPWDTYDPQGLRILDTSNMEDP